MNLLSLLWYIPENRCCACDTKSVSSATDVTQVVVKYLSNPRRLGEPALGLLAADLEKKVKLIKGRSHEASLKYILNAVFTLINAQVLKNALL